MKNVYIMCLLAMIFTVNSVLADTVSDPEKIPGWVVVHESDSPTSVIRGSINKLVKAIRNGADIKILLNDQQSIRCDNVNIYNINVEEYVACENFTNVALIDGLDPLHIRTNPYRTYQWFDTLHRNALARASIYDGANVGQTVSSFNTKMCYQIHNRIRTN